MILPGEEINLESLYNEIVNKENLGAFLIVSKLNLCQDLSVFIKLASD